LISFSPLSISRFQTKSFVPIEKSIIKYGCIDNVELVEKRKFPLEYFPTNRWSRKGYLRTRWRIKSLVDESEGFTSASSTECKKEKEISTNSSNENNFSHPLSGPPCTTFDLVNIHLFHDADNIKSFKTFPSVFACCRQKALEYTLRELSDEKPTSETNDSTVPFFIFGDFNFRLNAKKVVSTLVLNNESPKEETKPSSSPHKSDTNYSVHDVGDDVILFKNKLSENTILSVGKKEFKLRSSKFDIFGEHWKLLKECDFETSSLYQSVVEFPLTFPPSYPFEENLDLHPIGDIGKLYMKTRCPAWCDRILVSLIAKKNLFSLNGVRKDECCDELESRSRLEDNNGEGVEYNVMGRDVCMGDHKPVYLKFRLQHGADNISEALVNLSSIDHDGSYLPRSQNECPEEFPRIESPTYIDLLKNTDLNQPSPIQASKERTTDISEGFTKPSKTGSTSSSSPSSATTNVNHLNTTYTFKETTV
jgi:inositol-1,4,5-trisphosphate 5-phosphatase